MTTRFEHDMDSDGGSMTRRNGRPAGRNFDRSDVRSPGSRRQPRPPGPHGRAGQAHQRPLDDHDLDDQMLDDDLIDGRVFDQAGFERAEFDQAGFEEGLFDERAFGDTTLFERSGADLPDGFDEDVPEEYQRPFPPRRGPDARERAAQAEARLAEERTRILMDRGRASAGSRGLSRGKLIGAAAVAAVLAIVITVIVSSGGASWPASVTTVRAEIAKACQNPDVRSEPGQVNFACAQSTNQVLWVLALLTSNDNSHFRDPTTGRKGLEPITPAQGGEVAWSLNLHSPDSPVDSLAVAARAINNIVGGATVTGSSGKLVIQPGLESDPANCLRYTGSAQLTKHTGYPSLCAKPVSSVTGQAALVADIYQKWIVGASPQAAQDAALLFQNADNPGDPAVQNVLKQLPNRKFMA